MVPVIPAEAGIQAPEVTWSVHYWTPVFAAVTERAIAAAVKRINELRET